MNEFFYHNEPTLLNPRDTTFRMDAIIIDAEHWNRQIQDYTIKDGTFSVVFQPYSYNDDQMFREFVEEWTSYVEINKEQHSNKHAKPYLETKEGWIYSSQLFTPKLNVEAFDGSILRGKLCSLCGHLRDLPLGEIVFQVDYLDVYDEDNGIVNGDPDKKVETITDDDW